MWRNSGEEIYAYSIFKGPIFQPAMLVLPECKSLNSKVFFVDSRPNSLAIPLVEHMFHYNMFVWKKCVEIY